MKITIKTIKNKFPACPGVMSRSVSEAFGDLGPQLLSTMQGKTPVDTGELRASENVAVGGKELRLTAGAEHAKYVEFGTRKMAAQPFMGPTMDGASGQVGPAISSRARPAFEAL